MSYKQCSATRLPGSHNVTWEVVGKLMQSESFSIVFVYGQKRAIVSNLIKMSQKLRPTIRTQQANADKRTDKCK